MQNCSPEMKHTWVFAFYNSQFSIDTGKHSEQITNYLGPLKHYNYRFWLSFRYIKTLLQEFAVEWAKNWFQMFVSSKFKIKGSFGYKIGGFKKLQLKQCHPNWYHNFQVMIKWLHFSVMFIIQMFKY